MYIVCIVGDAKWRLVKAQQTDWNDIAVTFWERMHGLPVDQDKTLDYQKPATASRPPTKITPRILQHHTLAAQGHK